MKIPSVAGARAEHLFPSAGSFGTGRFPHLAKLRDQAVLVLLKIIHQFLRHRPGVSLIGQRRTVARVRVHSHFVLHLNHDDRVPAAIHGFDVPHQGRKGAHIGVTVRLAERGEQFLGLTG